MEASGSQMAVVPRIEEAVEGIMKEFTHLQKGLYEINSKLLPPVPQETSKDAEKAVPTGWFNQLLDRLNHLRSIIIDLRVEECERLQKAVAAGTVKRAE